MFESLSQRLNSTIERLRGRARLTDANIRESLREVRIALLEADVALPVVQALIQRVQVRAVGQEVLKSLTPGQALVKVVRDELTAVMGTVNTDLNLAAAPPAIVLMAGLQGAGKTTTVAKLAKFLKDRKKKKVMVVSCDVYRPAAIEQLRTLAEQVDVLFHPSTGEQDRQQRSNAQHAVTDQCEHHVQLDLPFQRQWLSRRGGEHVGQHQHCSQWKYQHAKRGDRPRDVDEQTEAGNAGADDRQRRKEVQVDAAAVHANENRGVRGHGERGNTETQYARERTAMQKGQGEDTRRCEV